MRVEGGTLFVVATGRDDSLDEVKAYGAAVLDAAAAHACTRVLCDERGLEYALGTLDTYEYAKYIAERSPLVGKAAVACGYGSESEGAFWEDVAANRGVRVRVFNDVGAARAWLEDDDE
jgi:hypothetical protein